MPKLLKTNRLSSMNINSEFKIVGYRYFLLVRNMNDVFSFLLGIPVYFCASLIEMSIWRGTDAASLKKGIGNIFEDKGRVPLKEDEYKHKIISCTSDGASVNFGRNTGIMTRLAVDPPWLIKIQCTNHRIELAVKGALGKTTFNECDTLYIRNY